jgi:hypothetical protein
MEISKKSQKLHFDHKIENETIIWSHFSYKIGLFTLSIIKVEIGVNAFSSQKSNNKNATNLKV